MSKSLITAIALLASTLLQAQGITIRVGSGAQFGRQLVDSWIAAYRAQYPDADIVVAEGDEADIELVPDYSVSPGSASLTIRVARYALLPVTSRQNPQLDALSRRNLSSRDVKGLFFQADAYDDEGEEEAELKRFASITVYSGSGRNPVGQTLSVYFGRDTRQLKGKKIAGDDKYIVTAVERDANSLAYANVAHLFDLQSRKLRGTIALLPVKAKREQSEAIATADVDNILTALEEDGNDVIPVGYLSLTLRTLCDESSRFIDFVTQQGQDANHGQGFLRIDPKTAQSQQQELAYLIGKK